MLFVNCKTRHFFTRLEDLKVRPHSVYIFLIFHKHKDADKHIWFCMIPPLVNGIADVKKLFIISWNKNQNNTMMLSFHSYINCNKKNKVLEMFALPILYFLIKSFFFCHKWRTVTGYLLLHTCLLIPWITDYSPGEYVESSPKQKNLRRALECLCPQ